MGHSSRIIYIDILRSLCILLLLTYHSFAIYTGGWIKPDNVPDIPLYGWIGKLSYSFMLPMWVFISGHIWGHQVYTTKKVITLKGLIIKKTKKLIIPTFVFGILYILAFGSILELIKPIGLFLFFCGEGHLWFLPMLFWVFVFSYFLIRIPLPEHILFPIVVIISICSWNLPSLGIGNGIYYLMFFYFGLITAKNNCMSIRLINLVVFLISFILLFIILNPILDNVWHSDRYSRPIFQILIHLIPLPYQFVGIMFFYGLALRFDKYFQYNSIITFIAGYSFGIYIAHQFILFWLYYHTSLSEHIDPMFLPWFALITTTILSVLFVNICFRFKIGRKFLS